MKGNVAACPRRAASSCVIPHHTFPNHNGGDLVIGADNMLYISVGDGGGGGDTLHNGQNTNVAARQDPAHQPASRTARRRTRSRPTTRSSARPASAARSGCTACATRGASRSTARPTTCGSATSARTSTKRSTTRTAGQKGINWGWNLREGFHPYNGGAKPPGARDPILERSHTAGDCAIIGGYVYRGPGDRRRSTARTCSATSAPASCARSCRRTARSRSARSQAEREPDHDVRRRPVRRDLRASRSPARSTGSLALIALSEPQRTTSSRSASGTLAHPVSASAFSSSSCRRVSNSTTPASPAIASAHRYGRPISTASRAEAQRAQHVATGADSSVDQHRRRRHRGRDLLEHDGGRHDAVELAFAVVRHDHARAPWSIAARASSACSTPFTRTGQRRELDDALNRLPRDRRVERRRVRPRT